MIPGRSGRSKAPIRRTQETFSWEMIACADKTNTPLYSQRRDKHHSLGQTVQICDERKKERERETLRGSPPQLE